MEIPEALRCLGAVADHMELVDQSPRAAEDLRSIRSLLEEQSDQLKKLTEAIKAHQAGNDSNCNNLSCEKGCGYDLLLYEAAGLR